MFLTLEFDNQNNNFYKTVAIPSNRVNVSYGYKTTVGEIKEGGVGSQSPQIGSMFLTF